MTLPKTAFSVGEVYGCDAAAVITGAQFMPSARQLADRLGCKLIDGSQIPDLIEGRVFV